MNICPILSIVQLYPVQLFHKTQEQNWCLSLCGCESLMLQQVQLNRFSCELRNLTWPWHGVKQTQRRSHHVFKTATRHDNDEQQLNCSILIIYSEICTVNNPGLVKSEEIRTQAMANLRCFNVKLINVIFSCQTAHTHTHTHTHVVISLIFAWELSWSYSHKHEGLSLVTSHWRYSY